MLNLFNSIFDVDGTATITIAQFMLCLGIALACGVILSVCYSIKSKCTKSFAITLALLPAVVEVVIMLVNGNIGAGVAVAGAFSLVRFRSSPGTAKEISAIFIAMCVGLAVGMGFVGYAVLFTVIMGAIILLLNLIKIWDKGAKKEKILRITIPEDLDYSDVFNDIFEKYTEKHESISVKTTNMGSMFKLKFLVTLKDPKQEKQFIDELRTRNGNLEIAISNAEAKKGEL